MGIEDDIKDIKELRSGRIPQHIADEYQILPEDNTSTREFAGHMQKLWERLVGATAQGGYNPEKHKARFLLSASDEPNAFIFSEGEPPTIVFTKGLINRLETEGELAGVLMHEKLHRILKEKLGMHPNSYMEESGADAYGAYALYKAGFPPSEMASALKKLPDAGIKNVFEEALQIFSDPHPPLPDRVRTVEDASSIMQRMDGPSRGVPEAIDPQFKAIIASASYESALDRKIAAVTEEGIAPAEQLRRATAIIPELERLPANDWAEKKIGKFLSKRLPTIKFDTTKPEDLLAYQAFTNRLLAKPEVSGASTGALHNYLSGHYLFDSDDEFKNRQNFDVLSPVERAEITGLPAKEIHRLSKAIVNATSEEAFLESAGKLTRILDNYNTNTLSFAKKLSSAFARYAIPNVTDVSIASEDLNTAIQQAGDNPEALRAAVEKHGIKLPWNDHVKWAQHAMEQGHPEAMKALHYLMMGEIDPRIVSFPEVNKIALYSNPHKPHDYLINPDVGVIQGRIYEVPTQKVSGTYRRELNTTEEQARLAIFDLQQKAAAATADWGLLERDFHEFTRQYRRFLSPLGQEITESAPFAQRFVEESEKLLAKDREKYAPMLKEFLGITDESTARIKEIATHVNTKDVLEYATALRDYQALGSHPQYTGNHLESRWGDAFTGESLKLADNNSFAIHPNHPLAKFVVEDPHAIFSINDKVALLSGSVAGITSPTALPETVYGFKTPETLPELRDALQVVRQKQLMGEDNYAARATDYLRYSYLTRHPDAMYSREDLEPFTERYSIGNGAGKGIPELQDIQPILDRHNVRLSAYEVSQQASLEDTVRGYRSHITKGNNSYFKEHPEVRAQYEEKIRAGLEGLTKTNPSESNRLTKLLLFSEFKEPVGEIGYIRKDSIVPDFLNTRFKQEVMSWYVKSEAALLGADTHTAEYARKAKAVIDDIATHTTGNDRYGIVRDLTDAIISGKEVSYYARDKILEVTNAQIGETDKSVRGATLANQLLPKEAPEKQSAFLKFLQYEGSPANTDGFLYVLEEKHKIEELNQREADLRRSILEKEAEIEALSRKIEEHKKAQAKQKEHLRQLEREGKRLDSPEMISARASYDRLYVDGEKLTEARRYTGYDIEHAKREIEDDIKRDLQNRERATKQLWNKLLYDNNYGDISVTEEQKRAYLQTQHDNFWAMGTEARTLFLSRQLFPTDLPDAEVEAHFQQQKSRILNEQLPDSMKNGADARVIAEKYLEHIPREEARLMLSSLIASRDPRVAHEASLGDAIGLLAKAMGSAENKLAQVGHSFEGTPEDIRAGLEHSKSNYKVPPRWTVHDWVSDFGPTEAATAKVGGVLGAGSYNVTIPVEYTDGRQTALNMLRPHVEDSAAYGFDILENTARALVKDNSKYQPLLDLVQETRRQLPDETNTQLAAGQASTAHKNYHGTVVKADGYEFHITTADWVSHGERYKETLIAPGKHFNDLPESTPEELAFKKAAAKALFVTELAQWAQGHATDPDRHGKQQKVLIDPANPHVALVTMFDHGMQKLEAPSLKTQMMAGKTIESALARSKSDGIEFSQALASVIDEKTKPYTNTEPPPEIQHLSSLKRGLLQMSDFTKYMDKTDIAESVAAIRKSGRISVGLGVGILQERVSNEGLAGLLPRFGGDAEQVAPEKKIVLSHDVKTVEKTKVRLNPSYAALVGAEVPRQIPSTAAKKAVVLDWNPPADRIEVVRSIAGAGFPGTVMMGGALRDAYLGLSHFNDYDTWARFEKPVDVQNKSPEERLIIEKELKASLRERISKIQGVETITGIEMDLGDYPTAKVSFMFRGKPAELSLSNDEPTSELMALRRNATPINSIAMDSSGKVVAHPLFQDHAERKIFAPENPSNEDRERFERLSKKIPGLVWKQPDNSTQTSTVRGAPETQAQLQQQQQFQHMPDEEAREAARVRQAQQQAEQALAQARLSGTSQVAGNNSSPSPAVPNQQATGGAPSAPKQPPTNLTPAVVTEAAAAGAAIAAGAIAHNEQKSSEAAKPKPPVKAAHAPSRAAAAIHAANAPIGVAMGAHGLYEKLGDKDSAYHQDKAAGGTRATMANVGLAADAANVGVGVVDSAHGINQAIKAAKAATAATQVAEGTTGALGVAKTIAGRAAIPLAVVAGAAETGAAIAAKDGHRAATAVGSTVGGIAAGIGTAMATGALVGSVIPGAGTVVGAAVGLVTGIGGALLGGWLGGKVTDAVAGDWADKQLKAENQSRRSASPAAATVKTAPVQVSAQVSHGLNATYHPPITKEAKTLH